MLTPFERFLASENIGPEAEIVPLLKRAWNAAVDSAEEMLQDQEAVAVGIGFGSLVEK
jgi:hypothetical protein